MALKNRLLSFLSFAAVFVLIHIVSAHESESTKFSFDNPIPFIIISGIWLIVLVVFSIVVNTRIGKKGKNIIFLLMIIPVVLSSLYLGGNTIYENINSVTNGPVHWHADYQVWVCGEKLELMNPKGLSNRIGSPLLHEHNDERIHAEGTLSSFQEADLQHYFEAIGGLLESDHITYPTTSGIKSFRNGESCGSGSSATLKVYVNGKLIPEPEHYVLYPSSYVPPGDCVIIVFDESSAETIEKLCESWEVKGWNYESYKRPQKIIGDKTWR